ncbi:hypothetical protein SK128_006640 [Halocaridina rubra]|uniref:C2H2-type domain-containing protein n=1 Tax=Halocaridina rubra TaxID=373956 RepID=A0AAN8XFM3_HALRR
MSGDSKEMIDGINDCSDLSDDNIEFSEPFECKDSLESYDCKQFSESLSFEKPMVPKNSRKKIMPNYSQMNKMSTITGTLNAMKMSFENTECHLPQSVKSKHCSQPYLTAAKHPERKKLHCDVCGKKFFGKLSLSKHMNIHTRDDPFKCDVCDSSFPHKGNLVNHMNTHNNTGEKPHACTICKQTFSRKSYITSHMLVHTGEKPYGCKICGKAFRRTSNLVGHLRTHSYERPYSCSICSKSFSVNGSLKTHLKLHTGERKHRCNLCSKAYIQKGNLITHMRTHSEQKVKVFECSVCKTTFRHKGGLAHHRRLHARMESELPTDGNGLLSQKFHTHVKEEDITGNFSLNSVYNGNRVLNTYQNRNNFAYLKVKKEHACDLCKQIFSSLRSLWQHRMLHAVVKLHKCDVLLGPDKVVFTNHIKADISSESSNKVTHVINPTWNLTAVVEADKTQPVISGCDFKAKEDMPMECTLATVKLDNESVFEFVEVNPDARSRHPNILPEKDSTRRGYLSIYTNNFVFNRCLLRFYTCINCVQLQSL